MDSKYYRIQRDKYILRQMSDNIFKRVYRAVIPEKRYNVSYNPTTAIGLPYTTLASPLSIEQSLQLSAVYRCVEVISNDIASQSWEVQKYDMKEGFVTDPFHYASYLLNIEPNPGMTRFSMMKTAVAKLLLEGNAYIIITRDNRGDPKQLNLTSDYVKMFRVPADGSIYYEVGSEGNTIRVNGEDMIHLINYSYNGLIGVSTLTYAATSLSLADSSEKSAKGFFSSGANMSGILTAEGKMTKEKATALKASWAEAFNVTSGNPGGIAVMESGLEFKPVTVNPKDAQMLETRKYNVVDICRFFGVHPSKVFDDANLTYSNVESFQLNHLSDTISPLDIKIESEFNRKLLRPSERRFTKLNLSLEELLRANLDAKANYTSKMFQCGGFTVNEVRKECGKPQYEHENANIPMVQINMAPVSTMSIKQKPIDKNNKLKDNE